jgi:hypothetical protein
MNSNDPQVDHGETESCSDLQVKDAQFSTKYATIQDNIHMTPILFTQNAKKDGIHRVEDHLQNFSPNNGSV